MKIKLLEEFVSGQIVDSQIATFLARHPGFDDVAAGDDSRDLRFQLTSGYWLHLVWAPGADWKWFVSETQTGKAIEYDNVHHEDPEQALGEFVWKSGVAQNVDPVMRGFNRFGTIPGYLI